MNLVRVVKFNEGGHSMIYVASRHGAEYIFMSTSTNMSTLLVDEYKYKYIAKT